jgi:hypothetical protein
MAEILGVGLTHYPPLAWPDRHMADILRWTLADPDIPADRKDETGWPEPMRAEYGVDGGEVSAAGHRAAILDGLRRARAAIDEFRPDVVLVWGDDQYENFKEECIPPFSVLALEDTKVQPHLNPFMGRPNVWGEDEGTTVTLPGARAIGKHLVTALLDEGFDMAYSYTLRSEAAANGGIGVGAPHPRAGMPGGQGPGAMSTVKFPHAFLNTVLYLDYDRTGWDLPILPVAINCYGRHVITRHGGLARFADAVPPDAADPPSPSPARCFDLGRAVARVLAASPWRVVLTASSSWSHAFLTDSTWRLYPDIPADRRLYQALVDGDFDAWRRTPLHAIEDAGQQEMLNWFCLLGAVSELGLPLDWSTFVETWVFNSNKCFAVWR